MPTPNSIGTSIRRREDPRLLTGSATYVDDFTLPGMLYLALLRSPSAHARVASLDLTAARAHPDVVAVFEGADLDGLLLSGGGGGETEGAQEGGEQEGDRPPDRPILATQ